MDEVPFNCFDQRRRWPHFKALGQYLPLLDVAALEEVCQLLKQLFPREPLTAIEIGSFVGTSAMVIADHDFDVHCVDTWEGMQGQVLWDRYQEHGGNAIREVFLENTARQSRIKSYRGRSDQLATQFAPASAHLVWIDGDHTYEGCKSDMLLYREKLKPGGILMGHDYSYAHPGVLKVVNEIYHDKARLMGLVCWAVPL